MKLGLLGIGHQGKKYINTCGRMGIQISWTSNRPRFDADAVIIATPAWTHFELAKEAILKGCHVLIEKPMTMCISEAQALYELAQDAGITGYVGHTHLYSPAWRKLKKKAKDVIWTCFKAGGPCKTHPSWDWGSHGAAMAIDLGTWNFIPVIEMERIPLTMSVHCEEEVLIYDAPKTNPLPMDVMMTEFIQSCKRGNDVSGIKMGLDVAKLITL